MSLRLLGSLTLLATIVLGQATAGESTLVDNLRTAYTHEVTSAARYTAFAARAGEEGYQGIAALMRAAALTQTIRRDKHATLITDNKGEVPKVEAVKPEVKGTAENLATLIADTRTEIDRHTGFATANKDAARPFQGVAHVSGELLKLYEQAAKDLDSWKSPKTLFVCQVCAWIGTDPKAEKCPVCAAPKSKFTEVR